MTPFALNAVGPFSLAESARFLGGFVPASGTSASDDGALTIAFRLDGTFAPAGVVLRPDLTGEAVGTGDRAALEKQVARMLSLDHDATGLAALGARDPVVAKLLAAFPGFRPVCFPSPWEAAVWGILAARVPMKVAATIRRRIAGEHGDTVNVGGHAIPVFPGPRQVLALETMNGLPAEKWQRIRGLADAALAGVLDADRLRALPTDFALAELSTLRGVGAWTSAHILLRGAGTVDVEALGEPRVGRAIAFAYGLSGEPSAAKLREISESWRPFRTWMAVLFAVNLARNGEWRSATGKRGKRRKP